MGGRITRVGRHTVVAVAGALALAGCGGGDDDPTVAPAPPSDTDTDAADAHDADVVSTGDGGLVDGPVDDGDQDDGDELDDDELDDADDGAGAGPTTSYVVPDEVCATFEHEHFEDTIGTTSTVTDDDVTSIMGVGDYLYCEIRSSHDGPDTQYLAVAVIGHGTPDVATASFEASLVDRGDIDERPGPWQRGAITTTAVTFEERYSADLSVVDGPLEITVTARTLESFGVEVWAEPLERIATEVLGSLRTG